MTVLVVPVLVMLAFGPCSMAQGGVIYSDDFRGAAGTPLYGTVPDVAPAGQFWCAGALWEADGGSSLSPFGDRA